MHLYMEGDGSLSGLRLERPGGIGRRAVGKLHQSRWACGDGRVDVRLERRGGDIGEGVSDHGVPGGGEGAHLDALRRSLRGRVRRVEALEKAGAKTRSEAEAARTRLLAMWSRALDAEATLSAATRDHWRTRLMSP